MAAIQTYGVIKLHDLAERCWAVVNNATGAIHIIDGKLQMRLLHEEALALAAALSRPLVEA